tara:strand:- start:696 stop:887 length:192 start_codon:yes stop_codon:yes gene_type:complete
MGTKESKRRTTMNIDKNTKALLIEHTGTLAEFHADMEELRRRAAGEGEWNDEAWEALDEPNLN